MVDIREVKALEVLDSRGKPTIKAYMKLVGDNFLYSVCVPSGASTGINEAMEIRDGDQKRFGGNGCLKVVESINTFFKEKLENKDFLNQSEFDNYLLELDGTKNKTKFGGNCLLALSLVFAKAHAGNLKIPLFEYFSLLANTVPKLPTLTINLFSGGKHAGGQAPIQDILLVPQVDSIQAALEMTYNIYYKAASNLKESHNMRLLRADEGGLSPDCNIADELFDHAKQAILDCGYVLGQDIFLAVDVAASHFHENGQYNYHGKNISSIDLIEKLAQWQKKYSIISIEDGLEEEDWDHWPELVKRLNGCCEIMGDDLLCTNPTLIKKAQASLAATALLLKVNQVGTLSEALESFKLAKNKDWRVTVSARSGETEDSWLADLAYGLGADYIKIGSITQSERLSKYNRLLEIEAGIY
ncbi:MAG: phosphopyruvate hydratase [Planctomycetota bacterium]|nr:MAG: phosphopyruvate hydratase [Planctomycetota bacterium]